MKILKNKRLMRSFISLGIVLCTAIFAVVGLSIAADASEEIKWVEHTEAESFAKYRLGYKITEDGAVLAEFEKEDINTIITLTVPNSVNLDGTDYNVIGIADGAFSPEVSSTKMMKNIIIGANVKYIGESAFKNNGTLESITLPAGLDSIGTSAFEGCVTLSSVKVFGDESGKNALPSGIATVSDKSFFGCVALEYIDLSSAKIIGNDAFTGATKLKDINISSAEKIGNNAFRGTAIENLKRAHNLKEIGEYAFAESALVLVRTGKSLQKVGEGAFYDCGNLSYFDIAFNKPEEEWGTDIFTGSAPAFALYKSDSLSGWGSVCGFSAGGAWVDKPDDADWLFTDKVVLDRVGESVDYIITNGATGDIIKGKEVPDSNGLYYYLYSDENSEFAGYAVIAGYDPETANTAIVIPDVVSWISGADTLDFKVTRINHGAFTPSGTDIGIVESIFVSESVAEVDKNAFDGLTTLKDIYIKSTETIRVVNDIGDGSNLALNTVWQGYNIVVNNVEKESGKTIPIGSHLYINHELNEYLTDKQGVYYYVDEVLGYAIVGDVSSGDDTSANTSKYSGSSYYSGARDHVIIPDYVSVGNAYYQVVGIGRYAFYNSSSVSRIDIGAFVGKGVPSAEEEGRVDNGKILDCAFRNAHFLSSFSVDNRNTVYACDFKNEANATTEGDILYLGSVIDGSVVGTKIVKAGRGVTSYDSNRTFFGNVSVVENYAFSNCLNLSVFDFGNITESIGEHAFNNTSLTDVILPGTVKVADYAFMNCYLVKKVSIGNDNYLGNFVFRNCYGIEEFVSESSVYPVIDGVLYRIIYEKDENGVNTNAKFAILMQYPGGNDISNSDYVYTVNTVEFGGKTLDIRQIEAYAFAYSNLPQIVIGEKVKFIGKAAFENSTKLRTITIGSGVIAIGIDIDPIIKSYQFDEDTEIIVNERLMYSERLELGIFDRTKVDIYEREAFDGCNVLARIKVDANNEYYHADSNGILYNKDKTALLVYSPGITRLSYTVPNTVKEIGLEAFEDNVHIQRLTLPEKIEKIGAKAFNGCTKLSCIYLRTLMAPAIGEQLFNSTGSLSKEGVLTIYCIPEPGVWLSQRPEMWDPYKEKVKQYVAIQEVPEQAQPTAELYLIYVIDTDGNYLPGMRVEYAYKGISANSPELRKYISVNEQGYAILTLPAELSRLYEGNAISLIISDDEGIYYEFNAEKNFFLDLSTGYSYVTLRSIPGVNGESCEGEDIDTGRVIINTAGHERNETVEIIVGAYWDKASIITEISLKLLADGNIKKLADAKWIDEEGEKRDIELLEGVLVYTDKNGNKIPISPIGSGKFSFVFKVNVGESVRDELDRVVPEKGIKEYEYYVDFVNTLDGKDNTVREVLDVDIFYYNYSEEGSVSDYIGTYLDDDNLSFSMSDSLPFIGGTKFDFEMGIGQNAENENEDELIKWIYDGDRAMLSVNMGAEDWEHSNQEEEDDDDDKPFSIYDTLAGKVDEMAEEMSKGTKAQVEGNLTIQLVGVFEFERTTLNGYNCLTRTYIKGVVTYEFSIGKTVIIWSVPVRLELEITAGGSIGLILEVEEEGLEPGFEFGISLEVEARAGFGCSLLSIGIYGNVSIELVFELFAIVGTMEGEVNFDLGFYAKLDVGFFTWMQKFSVVQLFGSGELRYVFEETLYDKSGNKQGSWVLKKDGREMKFANFETAITYGLNEMSTEFVPWDSTDAYNMYNGAEPEIVSYNGTMYKFYIDNVISNPNVIKKQNVSYDNYNYLKLVYQKYSVGGWGSPTVITADLNNETNFEICKDANGIHIIYTRVNDKIDANNAADYAKMLDVYTVTLKNDTFSDGVKLSSTDAYKSNLNITSVDGVIYTAWTENSEYNVLGMSNNYTMDENGNPTGDYTTDKNSVVISYLSAGNWITKSVSELGLIADIEFARDNLVVILDNDCDIATAYDRTFNYISAKDSSTVLTNVKISSDSEGLYMEDNPDTSILESDFYPIIAVRYENGMLYVRSSGALHSIAYDTVNYEIKATAVMKSLASDYKFIYDASGNLYGAIYVLNVSETSSNLYIRIYQNGSFSDEILLVENGVIDYYTYYILNGETVIYYKNMKIPDGAENGNANDIADTVDAVCSFAETKLSDRGSDLVLKNVYSKADSVAPGKNFDIKVTLYNNSLITLNGVRINVLIGENVIRTVELPDVSLLPGSSGKYTVTLSLEESEISEEYIISAEPISYSDYDTSNNSKDGIHLATPDLSVDAKYVVVGDIKYLLVIVQNTGAIPVNDFTVYVNNGVSENYNEDPEYLYMLSCGEDFAETATAALAPGAFKHYTVELNKVYFTDDFVTLTVVAGNNTLKEFNTANNVMAYSMEENEPVEFGKQYTLNYYVDNVLVYTAVYKAGASIDTSKVDAFEVKVGHTFSGWSGECEIMPSHDLNVYGYFILNKYNVNYYVDGKLAHTDSVEYGTKIPLRDEKYKLGYTFDGWYTVGEWDGLTDKYVAGVMGTENVNLYGRFTINNYTIKYYVDGEYKKSETYKYGETITIPGYDVPNGYTFSGWKLPSGVSTMPAYDINLYGTTQIQFYTLSYKVKTANGDFETVREIDVHYGGTIPYYDYQAPVGYNFGGWFDAEEGGNRVEASDNKKMPAANLTLYGTNTPRTYTVSYYVNDKLVNTARIVYGDTIPAYTYSFDGQSVTSWVNLPETMPARDVVVYSIATKNVYTVDYYIGGKYMYSDSYPYGASVELRSAEVKEGYTFSGWTGASFPNGTMPSQNVRLDGSYTINEYKIIYYVDSVLWREDKFDFGETVKAATYTPATGYTFSGFEGVPETMPAHDVYVYAKTSLNEYELSYYVDNKLVHTVTVPYGSEILSYKYDAEAGRELSVWSGLPETMPAENVKVYATTTIIKYTVSYYVDGTLVNTVTYNYGDTVTPFAYNSGDGKIFLGFEGVPETMPARNINIYGRTVNKTFHLNYYVDGELVYSDIYEYDALITPRENMTRYGYVFSGWGEIDRRMPAKDVDIFATMTKNSFKINYYIGEELVHTESVVFGEKITPFVPESKVGFSFGGWEGLPTVMQGEDISVNGKYVVNMYTVSYYVNGELYKTSIFDYNAEVDLFVFEADNYKVTGWKLNENEIDSLIMNDADVRLDAVVEDTTKFTEKPIFYILVSSLGTVGLAGAAYGSVFLIRRKKGKGI